MAAAKEPAHFKSLHEDALEGVKAWPGVTLRTTDEAIVGQCSVSGSYFYDERKIVVARSLSRRRQHFTALHELAHDLQERDEESVAMLEEEPDGGVALEDDICDAFAAEVLIPESMVAETIAAKGPTAANVVELFEASHASREACCVRAAQRLRGEGYVMLCDLEAVALFTAASTPYRVRRDTPQVGNEVIDAAIRWGTASRESRVRFASGAQSPRFFGNAVRDGEYVFGVFVSQMPAWVKGLTPVLSEPNYPIGASQGD